MSHCLSHYCDTLPTQKLMGRFGDRLQNMDWSDLLDLITIFAASTNCLDEDPHDLSDLVRLTDTMTIVSSVELDEALGMLDGFDRDFDTSMLLGLTNMLYQQVK